MTQNIYDDQAFLRVTPSWAARSSVLLVRPDNRH